MTYQEKMITIPADLDGGWTPIDLRGAAGRLKEEGHHGLARLIHRLANEIDRQCLPPMEEPVRLGSVVVARLAGGTTSRWVLTSLSPDTTYPWVDGTGDVAKWSDLITPRPATEEELTA